MAKQAGDKRPIVIKREEVVEGGHHGGAWKVAYADFVTAMMAFFLLMWLLNATTDDQRRGLADYFSPMNPMSRGASGSGRPFGGRTPFETGAMISDRGNMASGRSNDQDDPDTDTSLPGTPLDAGAREPARPGSGTVTLTGQVDSKLRPSPDARALALAGGKTAGPAVAVATHAAMDEKALRAELDRRERAAFEEAANQIRDAIQGDRLLADLSKQIAIDQTPEGLRIQLLDQDKQSMFPLGSAVMVDRARDLLAKMAPVLMKLSEPISIAGHTDATPYRSGDKTNWELSAERANTTRRLLVDSGLQEERIRSVTGNADRDPLLPADPFAAVNRRIAIVVLRTAKSAALAPLPLPGPAP
jgi:chemotaxis protein MotB